MKFNVKETTWDLMKDHVAKKNEQHKVFDDNTDFNPDVIREFSAEQIRLKLAEMDNRDTWIGYTAKSLDDAKDLVHYALFILETYLEEI